MLKRRWGWFGVVCLGFVLVGGPVGCVPDRERDNGGNIGGGTTDAGGEDVGEEPEPTELAIRAVRITPAEVFNDSVVRCEADAVAPGGAVPSVLYLWERTTTGAELGEGPVLNLAGRGLQPGGGLTCRAVATLDGARVTRDANVTILNRAPVVDGVTVSPEEAQVGETVTCEATVSDPDGGEPTVSFAWSTGASGASYVLKAGDVPGTHVTCTATATDLQGATGVGSGDVLVLNTVPVIDRVTVSPSEARVGEALRCEVEATDADGSELSYQFTWTTGSTQPTYTVQAGDKFGAPIGCTATVSDPHGGDVLGDSENFAIVVNSVPVVDSVTVSAATAKVGDSVTCEAVARAPDGEVVSVS